MAEPFDLFYLPFRPALDANGIVVAGASLTFYTSETLTKQTVYADAGLTTPLANPLTANAAGVWPSIYIDNTKTYRVRLLDADGGLLDEVDPYVPGSVGGAPGGTGPANSTYASLTDLKAAQASNLSFILTTAAGPITYAYVNGNFTGKADDLYVIKLNAVSLATGALVRQSVARSPEEFVATAGSGSDDKAAIQAALTNASGNGQRMGEVRLADKGRYRIDTSLRLDSVAVSFAGFATIDATRVPAGAVVTVDSTPASEFVNSYGYKGRMSGNVRLYGDRKAGSVGMEFNSQQDGGSAQLDMQGNVLARFATGVKLTERAYNSTFYRTEIFECDTAVDWIAGGADNGERNTFISATIYNSGSAFVNREPSSSIISYGGSIDYTSAVGEAYGGKIFLTDMHMESSVWEQYPYRAEGDGAFEVVKGGFILHAGSAIREFPYLAYVNAGGRMTIDGAFIHNMNLRREGPDVPTAFFNGNGVGVVQNTHGFDGGRLPDRLHAQYTTLGDPSYESTGFEDMVWIAGGGTITSRTSATNLTLSKSTTSPRSGTRCLRAQKITVGAGAEASFAPMWMTVRHPDKVLAGFHYRLETGAAQNFQVQWFWGKLDRIGADGLPIWFRQADALLGFNGGLGEALTADTTYRMHVFGRSPGEPTVLDPKVRIGLNGRYAPTWATHIFPVVRMFDMAQDTVLLIDDAWIDRW